MKTEISRRCMSSLVQAMRDKLGCKGTLDDTSYCKTCIMAYDVIKWDGEATGCHIQDVYKSLDWIDGGVY